MGSGASTHAEGRLVTTDGASHITVGCAGDGLELANQVMAALADRGFVVANVGGQASAAKGRMSSIRAGAVYVAIVTPGARTSKGFVKEVKAALAGPGVIVITPDAEQPLPSALAGKTPIVVDPVVALSQDDDGQAFERLFQEVSKFDVVLADAASLRPSTYQPPLAPGTAASSPPVDPSSLDTSKGEFDPEEVADAAAKLKHVAELALLEDDNALAEFVSTNGIHWTVANLELMFTLPVVAISASLALVNLAARDHATATMCLEAGAVGAVAEAMEAHRDDLIMQRLGIRALRLMALQRKILNEGCVQACVSAMRLHGEDVQVATESCRFVAAVATQHQFGEQGREMLLEAGAGDLCMGVSQDLRRPAHCTAAAREAVDCLT